MRSTISCGLVMFVWLGACSRPENAPPSPGTASDKVEGPQILATIGSVPITLSDVNSQSGGQLDQLDTQYQRARSRIIEASLDSVVRKRVIRAESDRMGKTEEELIRAEAGGTFEPTSEEVATWYTANKNRIGTRTLAEVAPQIAQLLVQERRSQAASKLKSRLYQSAKVLIVYEPFRLALNNDGAPSIGASDAPVTLVEFSDFQCPFCRQVAPSINQIKKEFGDKVRIVYRQFPISSIHPFAYKAAVASLCANEQGKFWELHDKMFAEQDRLDVPDLKTKAAQLGVDQQRFNTCLESSRYTMQIQRDLDEGARAGVNGTPALFVNGVEVPGGAVPYTRIAEAIERELVRNRKAN